VVSLLLAPPRPLLVVAPFDVVEAGPYWVVTDRDAGAVYRVNRASRRWMRVARVPEARELEKVDERTVLVTSGPRVLRLDVVTGRVRVVARARATILGLVRGRDGVLYVSEEGKRVVRVERGGVRRVLVDGRNGVHGLALDGGRLIACESYGGNVLSVDTGSGEVTTLAHDLGNPSYAVPVQGGLYVSEFTGDRIDLLHADGSVTLVARVRRVGPLFLARDGRLLAVTLQPSVVRVDPRTGRVERLLV
jgi:hypothetical protein